MKYRKFLGLWVLLFVSLSSCTFFQNPANVALNLSAWTSPGSRTALPTPITPALTSIDITVTGADMDTVQATFPGDATIVSLSVPPGKQRTISLEGHLASGSSSPMTKRTAEVTTDISAGPNTIFLTTGFETKLLIPDYYSSKVWQFDDMSGAGFTSATVTSPRHLDFDKYGRIYVATSTGIVTMNSLTGAQTSLALTAGSTTILTLAIDRTAQTLYHIAYTGGTYKLFAMPLDATNSSTDVLKTLPTTPGTVTLSSSSTGLAVDSQGMLYVLGTYNSAQAVIKINPTTMAYVNHILFSSISALSGLYPQDLEVKDNTVYLCANSGYEGNNSGVIVALSKDLTTVVKTYGSGSYPPDSKTIPMPQQFIAITNKKLYITDDRSTMGADSLVELDDLNDQTTTRYANSLFRLFYDC